MDASSRPSRKKLRLEGYDYNSPGYYHIVIVTEKREKILGNLQNGIVVISDYGTIIENLLSDFSNYNPGVEIIKHQIMPDHIHLLICLSEGENFESPPSISKVVSKLKTLSVWKYNNDPEAGARTPLPIKVWQRSFFDHVLRSNEEARYTFDYIDFNPDQKFE